MSVKRIQSVRLESGEESWNLENPGLKHGQDSAKGPPPDTSEDGCDPQPTREVSDLLLQIMVISSSVAL